LLKFNCNFVPVAVGTALTGRPPHVSRQAALPHPALVLSHHVPTWRRIHFGLPGLNTQPARSSVNASPPPLPATAHDSMSRWLARPASRRGGLSPPTPCRFSSAHPVAVGRAVTRPPPARIPACRITAPGSSGILASRTTTCYRPQGGWHWSSGPACPASVSCVGYVCLSVPSPMRTALPSPSTTD